MKFEVWDIIKNIEEGYLLEVTGVDEDFITVEDRTGNNDVVVKEDFDKYRVV